jgi:hypothetical protein
MVTLDLQAAYRDSKEPAMRAAIFNGPGSVTVTERPDPVIKEPTDAIARPGSTVGIVGVSDGEVPFYKAMDERWALKSLLGVGAV